MNSIPSTILIVFPHIFTSPRSGVQRRFLDLTNYFYRRGFGVDLVAITNFETGWIKNYKEITIPGIRNLFLYDHSKGLKATFIRNIFRLRFSENNDLLGKTANHLPDYAFSSFKRLFNQIVNVHKYDYILISYVQWANLVNSIRKLGTKTILTMEDCLSKNIAENHQGNVPLNCLLQEETALVNLFDKVINISWEEMEFFSKHSTKPEFQYIPVFMDPVKTYNSARTDFDLLFVGSDHPSNQRGIRWFFDRVFPLLSPDLKILCVGSIVRFVPDKVNVVKISFTDDLHALYHKARLTINPLLDGTGMKVKLIESMAHGVPVVTTTAGLSGIRPELKHHFMVGDKPSEFAAAIDRLISDNGLYLDYSENLNRIFNEHFTTEVAARTLDTIFTG